MTNVLPIYGNFFTFELTYEEVFYVKKEDNYRKAMKVLRKLQYANV